jgi:hypothetical protein
MNLLSTLLLDPMDQANQPRKPTFNMAPLTATFLLLLGQAIEVVNVHSCSIWKFSQTSPDAQPFEFRQSDADVNGSVTRFAMSQAIQVRVGRITWLFWVTLTSSSLTFRSSTLDTTD